MRKIKLYIATSIDGFIARANGDLDWLTEFPNPQKTDYGYLEFVQTIDTVIMGGRTYDSILSMDTQWPYGDKECYIITRNYLRNPPGHSIEQISDNVIEQIKELKVKQGKDIWLIGGSEIISLLMNNNLIDEMIITYIPVILGSGICMFSNINQEINWKAFNSVLFDNGTSQITYILMS